LPGQQIEYDTVFFGLLTDSVGLTSMEERVNLPES
jgi:hypothetical protein